MGIDTAETKQLIAHNKTVEQIRQFLGADSLGYLSEKGMLSNKFLQGGFCSYCFNGREMKEEMNLGCQYC